MNGEKTLRETVAEEVRALLARRQISGAELARRLDLTQRYMSRRLTGETPFDVDDLEKIAAVLSVEVTDLMPRSNEGRTVVFADGARRQTTVPYPHLTKQPHPFSHPKRTVPMQGTRRPVRLSQARA